MQADQLYSQANQTQKKNSLYCTCFTGGHDDTKLALSQQSVKVFLTAFNIHPSYTSDEFLNHLYGILLVYFNLCEMLLYLIKKKPSYFLDQKKDHSVQCPGFVFENREKKLLYLFQHHEVKIVKGFGKRFFCSQAV